jgi:predicted  nucleic acid-binding Zn-ribbon protein
MGEIKILKYMSNKKMKENEKLEVEFNELIAESNKLRRQIEDLRVRNGRIIMALDAYEKDAKNHAKGAAAKGVKPNIIQP